MADAISRLYLQVYETNKNVGKTFLAVYLLLFVLSFLAVQMTTWTGWMGTVSTERPSRMLGVDNMHKIGNEFKAAKADSTTLPMLGSRPSRIKGVWNMRMVGVL